MRVEDHIEIVETDYENLAKARMRYEVGKKGGNTEIIFN